jgi:hypothetical protein
MNLFRPAARATLWRWREVISGAAILAFGIWWAMVTFSPVRWLAVVILVTGAAIVWTGVQRLRFRQGGGGAGVVQVVERRLAYWGPLTGGIMDMDDLARLSLDPTGRPMHWVLVPHRGEVLHIPVNAEGADVLFDLFSALPGIRTQQMLDLMAHPRGDPVTLWESRRLRLV